MLAIAFAALSILSVVAVSAFLIVLDFQTQRAMVASQQQNIALQAAQEVSGLVEQVFGTLESTAWSAGLVTGSEQQQQLLLGNLFGLQPAFREVSLVDGQGDELAKQSRLSLVTADDLANQAGSDWFAAVREDPRYISPVYIDDTTSEPLVTVAVPIRSGLGEFEGALVAEVNLKFMWDLVSSLQIGEAGLAYVVDRQANLIAFGDTSRVLRGENVGYLDEVQEFLEGDELIDEAAGALSTGINGTNVLATYQALGTPDWAVMVELPVAEGYQDAFRNVGLAVGASLVVALLAAVAGVFVARRLAAPLLSLTDTATRIAVGDTGLTAEVGGTAEVSRLAAAFNSMTGQLRDFISSLEQQVADRTRDLARRSGYLEAGTEVSRVASSILETDELIRQVVDLIRDRFGLYYVGLFLVEEAEVGEEWAVLRAGTGSAGRAMLARGHRIRVGEGMVGWSAAHGQPRVALAAGEDAVRLATAELPDTRSEAALPLRSRGGVIGALSVQHTEEGAFDQDTLAVLQTMADQVAVALDNARLFAESEAALEAERRAYGEIARQAWARMIRGRSDVGYVSRSGARVGPALEAWQPEMIRATQTGRTVRQDGSTVAIPVKIRDNVEGVVRLRKPDGVGDWTPREVELMETLAEELGQALESARLYQDTQRRAAQDRMLGEVTSRMRETLDMDRVLQTAIQEIGQALNLAEVEVRMGARPGGRDAKGAGAATKEGRR